MADVPGPTPRERRRALARIALGQAQVIAAVLGLVLFLQTGMSPATLTAVGVAGLLVLVSRAAFREPGSGGRG